MMVLPSATPDHLSGASLFGARSRIAVTVAVAPIRPVRVRLRSVFRKSPWTLPAVLTGLSIICRQLAVSTDYRLLGKMRIYFKSPSVQ
jgi:hypothetical protein